MSGQDDLIDLFLALDRAGPGDLDSLHWVLQVAGTPQKAQVLDAGCGTGADLPALLAARPLAQITAIDSAAPFIERVRARFPAVTAHVGDMANPPGGPYDLIWSAGAIYHLGVGRALTSWVAHLKPGGCVAFSDLCWRVSDPPAPACAFWQAEGLTLGSAEDLASTVTTAGWRVLGARWLGQGGWAAYYEPLAKHLDSYTGAPDLITALRAEIALWRAHSGSYDYRLIVAAPT